jgi:hypothetical protein
VSAYPNIQLNEEVLMETRTLKHGAAATEVSPDDFRDINFAVVKTTAHEIHFRPTHWFL